MLHILTKPLPRRISVFDAKLSVETPSSLESAHPIQSDHAGDQISIFGFSRGAFTARALAGMLQKVGLLPPCNIEQLPFAYSMYAREDAEGINLSQQFKRTFSVDVKIQFLGVWCVIPPTYPSIHIASYPPAGTPCNPSD